MSKYSECSGRKPPQTVWEWKVRFPAVYSENTQSAKLSSILQAKLHRQADRHRQSIKQRKKSQTLWSTQFRPHCWESAVAGGNGWKTLRALLAGILAAWLQPIITYFVRGMMRGFRPFHSDHAGKAPPLLAASSSRRMLLKQSVLWKVTRSKIQKFMTSGTPPQEQ